MSDKLSNICSKCGEMETHMCTILADGADQPALMGARELFEEMQAKGWMLPDDWSKGAIHFAEAYAAHVSAQKGREIAELRKQLNSEVYVLNKQAKHIADWKEVANKNNERYHSAEHEREAQFRRTNEWRDTAEKQRIRAESAEAEITRLKDVIQKLKND